MTTQDRIEKKRRKKLLTQKRRKAVIWKCINCGRLIRIKITIGHEDNYNEERKNRYICLKCRN